MMSEWIEEFERLGQLISDLAAIKPNNRKATAL